ncbi:hypothetical protein [Blastococcus sp. TF02A-35]|uniref:hypothetical protein n=1 Tax=Blastococcus sp. TF02A-35 TaxID=2559612 RepID=UPI0010744C2F|nr:hypothetical protein [Blastococcus sp. TF02A_35]TFV53328.1 hypothetical protein E4P43_01970 [Blastococcus sp. TF02A_35]
MPAGPRPRRLPARPTRRALAVEDAVRTAGDLVAAGRRVDLALDGAVSDALWEELTGRLDAAGVAGSCEVTVPVPGRVPPAGPALALVGPADAVDRAAAVLPEARVVVGAAEAGAEERCRRLAGRRVRLTPGRGRAADLAFARCLAVLMAGSGMPAVATTDPRLIAVTGERAAWNGRPPESWEYVMPWGAPTEEQHRLLAAGSTVRVQVPVTGGRA